MFDLVGLIDRYGPVEESILQQLEIRDIIASSHVCQKLSHVYKTTITTQCDINKALAWYFNSPVEFRSIQAETDAIISNSFALNFFLRKHREHQMVVFVRKGSSTTKMKAYVGKDGWKPYVSISRKGHDDVRFSGWACFNEGLGMGLTTASPITTRRMSTTASRKRKYCRCANARICFSTPPASLRFPLPCSTPRLPKLSTLSLGHAHTPSYRIQHSFSNAHLSLKTQLLVPQNVSRGS